LSILHCSDIATQASFRYPTGTRDALTPTSVSVSAGEALAVTGANGSGKSTLALLLAGLLRPSGGSVSASLALGRPAPQKARIGDVILFPRGNLQLVAQIHGPDGTLVQQPQFKGLHGGLTEDEALVPLLAVRP